MTIEQFLELSNNSQRTLTFEQELDLVKQYGFSEDEMTTQEITSMTMWITCLQSLSLEDLIDVTKFTKHQIGIEIIELAKQVLEKKQPTQVKILTNKISDFLKSTGLQFAYSTSDDFITFRHSFSYTNNLSISILKNAIGNVQTYTIHLVGKFSVTFQFYDITSVDKSRFQDFKDLIKYIIKNEDGE